MQAVSALAAAGGTAGALPCICQTWAHAAQPRRQAAFLRQRATLAAVAVAAASSSGIGIASSSSISRSRHWQQRQGQVALAALAAAVAASAIVHAPAWFRVLQCPHRSSTVVLAATQREFPSCPGCTGRSASAPAASAALQTRSTRRRDWLAWYGLGLWTWSCSGHDLAVAAQIDLQLA